MPHILQRLYPDCASEELITQTLKIAEPPRYEKSISTMHLDFVKIVCSKIGTDFYMLKLVSKIFNVDILGLLPFFIKSIPAPSKYSDQPKPLSI